MDEKDPRGEVRPSEAKEGNRRNNPRHLGKAVVTIYRESDRMRTGFLVKLDNISMAGMSVVSTVPMNDGEQIKIKLQNEVQRFVKTYRGVVRWQSPMAGQYHRIGIELLARLTPFDLMVLKRAGLTDPIRGDKIWV